MGDIISPADPRRASGEIIATVHALRRTAGRVGTDIHALGGPCSRTDDGALTDADKEKVRVEVETACAEGYAEGVRAAESRQHGTGAFRNTDGTLEWSEVALFLQREKHRLPRKHHEFIDDMASRTVVWARAYAESNINICTACSSSWEERSHERAGR